VTAPALIKEADMMRALRAAKKLGAIRVSIRKDGTIMFDMGAAPDYVASDATSGPLVAIDDRPDNPLVKRLRAGAKG
jgi:hypothetical protein